LFSYRMCVGGWKPTAESVAEKVEELKEYLPKLPIQSVIVLFLVDNAVYQVVNEAGDVVPPVQDERGVYHVTEYLDLVSIDKLEALLALVKEILNIFSPFRIIFMCPLPRYLVIPYCTRVLHLRNQAHPNFADVLIEGLSVVENAVQNFFANSNVQVVRAKDIFGTQNLFLKSSWKDGVHLSKENYGQMAMFLRRMIWDF